MESQSNVLNEMFESLDPRAYERRSTSMLIATMIGERIRTVVELVNLMGIPYDAAVEWLSGGHDFAMSELLDIQRILGIEIFAFSNVTVEGQ